MNIEEKQAIEMMKFYQEEYRKQIKTLKGNGEPEGYGTIIDTIKGRICNIQLLLNLIEKQQTELKKKKAVINEMATYIDQLTNELVSETGDNNLKCCESKECLDNGDLECKDCIIKYYENKVEREGK